MRCWHTYLVEDMSLCMGEGGFAVGTEVEIWAVDASPPNAANRHRVAAIARYASMNDAFVSLCPKSQQRFEEWTGQCAFK